MKNATKMIIAAAQILLVGLLWLIPKDNPIDQLIYEIMEEQEMTTDIDHVRSATAGYLMGVIHVVENKSNILNKQDVKISFDTLSVKGNSKLSREFNHGLIIGIWDALRNPPEKVFHPVFLKSRLIYLYRDLGFIDKRIMS